MALEPADLLPVGVPVGNLYPTHVPRLLPRDDKELPTKIKLSPDEFSKRFNALTEEKNAALDNLPSCFPLVPGLEESKYDELVKEAGGTCEAYTETSLHKKGICQALGCDCSSYTPERIAKKMAAARTCIEFFCKGDDFEKVLDGHRKFNAASREQCVLLGKGDGEEPINPGGSLRQTYTLDNGVVVTIGPPAPGGTATDGESSTPSPTFSIGNGLSSTTDEAVDTTKTTAESETGTETGTETDTSTSTTTTSSPTTTPTAGGGNGTVTDPPADDDDEDEDGGDGPGSGAGRLGVKGFMTVLLAMSPAIAAVVL